MDQDTFAAHVAGEIGLDDTSGSDDRTRLNEWLNEAVVQFLIETKCRVLPFEASLTANEWQYELSSSVLAFKNLFLVPADGSTNVILEPASSTELFERRRLATDSINPYLYSLEGVNLLLLYPTPQSSSDSLQGLYVPRPTEMSTGTQDPSSLAFGGIPTEFHPTLEEYMKWRAATWDDDASSKIGETYKGNWAEGVLRARMRINKKAGVRWAPARPGGRRRRLREQPPRPGIDMGN